MKKILSILLALILCLGVFVSCGDEETSSSESELSNKSEFSSESLFLSESQMSSETQKESYSPIYVETYYDEIENFVLKSNAPESGIYDTYDKLLNVLDAPVENFDEEVFCEHYILMVKNVKCSSITSKLGFQYVNCKLDSRKVEITLEMKIDNNRVDDVESPEFEIFMDALVVIPKKVLEKSFLGENNVVVHVIYTIFEDESNY